MRGDLPSSTRGSRWERQERSTTERRGTSKKEAGGGQDKLADKELIRKGAVGGVAAGGRSRSRRRQRGCHASFEGQKRIEEERVGKGYHIKGSKNRRRKLEILGRKPPGAIS